MVASAVSRLEAVPPVSRLEAVPPVSRLEAGALAALRDAVIQLKAGSRLEAHLPDESAVIVTSPAICSSNIDEEKQSQLLRHAAASLPPGASVTAFFTDGSSLSVKSPDARQLRSPQPAQKPTSGSAPATDPQVACTAAPTAAPPPPVPPPRLPPPTAPPVAPLAAPPAAAAAAAAVGAARPAALPAAQLPPPALQASATSSGRYIDNVKCPPNLGPSRIATVTVGQRKFRVKVPPNLQPGDTFAFVDPGEAAQSPTPPPPQAVPQPNGQASASPSGSQHFTVGQRVTLVNLTSRPELNGCVAILQGPAEATGRWNIKLPDARVVSLRPTSFVPCPAPANDTHPSSSAPAQQASQQQAGQQQAVLDAAWIEPLDDLNDGAVADDSKRRKL